MKRNEEKGIGDRKHCGSERVIDRTGWRKVERKGDNRCLKKEMNGVKSFVLDNTAVKV